MKERCNLVGQRFGRLVVICYYKSISNRTAWLCQCDCGNTHIASADSLKRGMVKSCGCLRREQSAINAKNLNNRNNRNNTLAF